MNVSRARNLPNLYFGFKLLLHRQRPRNQAQLLGVIQQIEGTFPIVFSQNRQFRLNRDFSEAVSGVELVNYALNRDFQISEKELRIACDHPEGCRIAARQGREKQFFRCPSALESSKLRGRREVD